MMFPRRASREKVAKSGSTDCMSVRQPGEHDPAHGGHRSAQARPDLVLGRALLDQHLPAGDGAAAAAARQAQQFGFDGIVDQIEDDASIQLLGAERRYVDLRHLADGPRALDLMAQALDDARRFIHFENYIIRDDATGRRFAERLGAVKVDAITQGLEEDIIEALESLPESFRLPVLFADVDGFSYKEIADMLDIPIGTVMSRLHRGRKALQRKLWNVAEARGLTGTAP